MGPSENQTKALDSTRLAFGGLSARQARLTAAEKWLFERESVNGGGQ